MLVAPLSKTPMDQKGSRSLNSYSKKLERVLSDMTPWTKDSKFSALRRKYGKSMGDSQILVTFNPTDDPDDPLFKDALTEAEVMKRELERRRKAKKNG